MPPLPNPFPLPAPSPYRGLLILLLVIVALSAGSIYWAAAEAAEACPADADCITVGYPTTYTDGSALPPADLDGGILEFKTATGWQHLATLKYPTLTYLRQPVSSVQTYRWKVLTKAGGMSAFVEAVPTAPPKEPSPGTLKVVSNIAYKPNLGYVNQLKVTIVGVVPLDSPCLPVGLLGLNLVDNKLLRTSSGAIPSPLPKQVLARCAS